MHNVVIGMKAYVDCFSDTITLENENARITLPHDFKGIIIEKACGREYPNPVEIFIRSSDDLLHIIRYELPGIIRFLTKCSRDKEWEAIRLLQYMGDWNKWRFLIGISNRSRGISLFGELNELIDEMIKVGRKAKKMHETNKKINTILADIHPPLVFAKGNYVTVVYQVPEVKDGLTFIGIPYVVIIRNEIGGVKAYYFKPGGTFDRRIYVAIKSGKVWNEKPLEQLYRENLNIYCKLVTGVAMLLGKKKIRVADEFARKYVTSEVVAENI